MNKHLLGLPLLAVLATAACGAHREIAVVPVEGGVEVLAFIDDAPEDLTCH